MKINSVNRCDAVSNYLNNVGSTPSKASPSVNISDSVELSEGAQKFSALIKAAKESLKASGSAEEIKVADIIDKLNNHSYNVSTDDVVNDILNGMPSNV